MHSSMTKNLALPILCKQQKSLKVKKLICIGCIPYDFQKQYFLVFSALNMVNGVTINGLGEVALDQGTSLINIGN